MVVIRLFSRLCRFEDVAEQLVMAPTFLLAALDEAVRADSHPNIVEGACKVLLGLLQTQRQKVLAHISLTNVAIRFAGLSNLPESGTCSVCIDLLDQALSDPFPILPAASCLAEAASKLIAGGRLTAVDMATAIGVLKRYISNENESAAQRKHLADQGTVRLIVDRVAAQASDQAAAVEFLIAFVLGNQNLDQIDNVLRGSSLEQVAHS